MGKRVAAVKAAVGNGTMFTMVMETSYPALPSNATNSTIPLPSAADFTAANQAACAAGAFQHMWGWGWGGGWGVCKRAGAKSKCAVQVVVAVNLAHFRW